MKPLSAGATPFFAGAPVHEITPENAWQILELLGFEEGDVLVEWPSRDVKPALLKREHWEELKRQTEARR